jgi:hypothetical protein
LNAHWLAQLLPGSRVDWANGGDQPSGTTEHQRADAHNSPTHTTIVDAHAFALADEGQPGALPHTWDVTSDAVAARVAVVTGASSLYLLKSVTIPVDMPWTEAAALGFVDPLFPQIITQASKTLILRAINFRAETHPLSESAEPTDALSRHK